MASLAGLRLRPTNYRSACVAALACIALITAYVLLMDAVLFRAHLPPVFLAFLANPDLPLRIAVMAVRAAWDEVAYRLVMMTAIAAVGGLFWHRGGKPHPAVFVAAILLSQLADILPQLALPSTGSDLAYDVLRYYLPGVVWGWLYWRHGFLASLIAHPLTHVVLQPLLLVALTA